MQLLPSLLQGDLAGFGEALSSVQRITGAWFAPQQGGIFAPGQGEALIARMTEWGALGVGQSSWGPAVYGMVEGADAARALAANCRDFLGGNGLVFEGGFARGGARIGCGGPPADND
jgi:predicted sugar kinase